MRLLISLFLILSIAACKKESENRSPEIRITAPTDGRTYLVGDTVLIEAEVKDDRLIKSLKLSLFETASKRTAGEVKYFQLNTQQHSFSYEYIIDKKGIQSGMHYFELMADDGENQNTAFVSVQIQQKALKSMGLIFIASTPLGLELYKKKLQVDLKSWSI